MGGANTKPLAQWSAAELSAACVSLGPAYEAYEDSFVHNGVDGVLLEALAAEDLGDVCASLGITNVLHQRKLAQALDQLKQSGSATAAPPSDNQPAVASVAALTSGGKRFGAFLSHYKQVVGPASSFTSDPSIPLTHPSHSHPPLSTMPQECGTEARLVANELRSLIPQSNIFLDS